MRLAITLLLVSMIGAAVPGVSLAAKAPTPGRAARATRACLVDHGWSARLADQGRTVNAKAPRHRTGYPSRPWYSVAFYAGGAGITRYNENRMALNRRENATATLCRRAGWHSA